MRLHVVVVRSNVDERGGGIVSISEHLQMNVMVNFACKNVEIIGQAVDRSDEKL